MFNYVFNAEIYALIFSIVMMIDYLAMYRHKYNDNSYIFLKLLISLIIISFLNIFITFCQNNDLLRYFLSIITFFLIFVPPMLIYEYLEKNYLKSPYYLENQGYIKFMYYVAIVLALSYIFSLETSINNIPVYLTSSFYFNRILIFSLIPIGICLIEYLYYSITNKKRRNLRLFLILIFCLVGVTSEFILTNLSLFSGTYMLCVFLLYSYRNEISLSNDKLTGLYNRDMLARIKGDKRKQGRKLVAVYMIDVDKFKMVNDTYGHDEGDKVLIDVGTILVSSVRVSDYVIRYGGDEFIIIATVADPNDVQVIIDKINVNIERYNKEHEIPISLSVGGDIAYPNEKGKIDIDRTIKRVDKRMYKAKRSKQAK